MLLTQTREVAPANSRIRTLSILFLLAVFLVLARLFTWQVINAADLKDKGRRQHRVSSLIPAHRGSILTSDNFSLVYSSEAWLIWTAPQDIEKKEEVIRTLAPLLAPEPEEPKEATESATPQVD